MTYSFNGHFSERIADFLNQKRSLGYSYENGAYMLNRFAMFASERFPEETSITKEMFLCWSMRGEGEKGVSLNHRITVLRQFAKYLISIGESAFILPNGFTRNEPSRPPYIFDKNEIAAFWALLENTEPSWRCLVKHMVIPTMFRMLCCCGLRPGEARKLLCENIDLTTGTLYVLESKGHNSRILPMPEDLTAYCRKYDERMRSLMPDRSHFFPNGRGTEYSRRQIDTIFSETWAKTGVKSSSKSTPRVYDFRHSFATHRLYLWMNEGEDISAMLPYLSAYMGHTKASDTCYYIHLVPGLFESMSGKDFSMHQNLLPEVPPL